MDGAKVNGDNESSHVNEKIEEFLSWNKNEKLNSEIQKLRSGNDHQLLSKLFLHRMEFGTAGLRGRMGPGYSQMNDLVIVQTSQGLLKYLSETDKDLQERGIVVGYDGRHNSRRFAELTASVFLHGGVKVYLYSKLCPTPFVPFAVIHYKCAAGVMVTASHNPKDDNGYKVYWSNGAQIQSPIDKEILKCIMGNLEPLESSWDTSIIRTTDLLHDPLTTVMKEYYVPIKEGLFDASINSDSSLKITYTPMHGVAYPYIQEAFRVAGFKHPLIPVMEQIEPDPDFPTVKFPNPEEGKSALDLSIQTADRNNSHFILANDPDADRLAAAEKTKHGEWKVFSGNELGALLGWWSFYTYKTKTPDANMNNVYMLASTVSSKILRSISRVEHFHFEETLTGFKWMGNRSSELLSQGRVVLFAFEEAIGFMCGTAVLDKDGVSAAIRLAELAAFLDAQGQTLTEKLQEIYKTYGYHISDNSYFICHEPAVIKRIFTRLRNFKNAPDTYPDGLLDGKYKIAGTRDLTTGYDSSQKDKKTTLPVSRSSQMITFTFYNGLVVTLRTSGTEPKIKYYTELCAPPEEEDLDSLKSLLQEMVDAIIKEYLQPDENGLIYRCA